MSIDILEMIKKKTKGNLDAEEEKLLGNVIADVQLNYVAEKEKDDKKPAEEKKDEPAENEEKPPQK